MYQNNTTNHGYKQVGSQHSFGKILDLFAIKANFLPRLYGRGYITRCTSHEDRNPRLLIKQGNDGCVSLNCLEGCSQEELCASIGITVKDLQSSRKEQQ